MKKILSLSLVGVMMLSALPMAYAADTQDYSLGTAVSYTADSEANRNYTITVPAELQPGQSGTVTLKGKWASNETVKVTADANVVLTNSINSADKHTLDIEFAGIEKAGDNTVEKTYTETVKVDDMPAAALFGTWSGKFNYNVEFIEEEAAYSFTIAHRNGDTIGTFQFEEGMTWAQFIESEYNPTANGDTKLFSVSSSNRVVIQDVLKLDLYDEDVLCIPDDVIINNTTYYGED